jgi:hypothetical protein
MSLHICLHRVQKDNLKFMKSQNISEDSAAMDFTGSNQCHFSIMEHKVKLFNVGVTSHF